MLDSRRDVVRCLVTYADWWQPASGSILKVAGARADKNFGDGLRGGLLETLEERSELSRRTALLSDRDRSLLFLWYVRQLHVDEIGDALSLSRRQCFRRRNQAIKRIVELGNPEAARGSVDDAGRYMPSRV
jgi:DNA-directed RNA polymerase specialized sigma24 family protein